MQVEGRCPVRSALSTAIAARLALDGVYVKSDDGGLRFLRLPRPSEDEVYDVAFRTAKKLVAMLGKSGRCVDGAASDDDEPEIEPALLSCYDIAG